MDDEITLEDLEIAIKIIDKFIKRYEEARLKLRRLSSVLGYQQTYSRPEDKLLDMVMKDIMAKKGQLPAEETPEELTEEEKERIKKLKEKLLSSQQR